MTDFRVKHVKLETIGNALNNKVKIKPSLYWS